MPDDALRTLIADVLLVAPERIDEESGLDRTENWDSLRNLMIMVEVERVFAVKLPFRAYGEATTVKAIRALIARAAG